MASKAITIVNWRKDIPGELTDDRMEWRFPPIRTTNARGKITEWTVRVRAFKGAEAAPEWVTIDDSFFDNKPLDGIFGWIKVDSGLVGGKTRASDATIVREGKRKDAANATNTFCQALRDALGLYNKQLKKILTAAEGTTRYPPMLAQIWDDQTTKPDFPLWAQRKYDGVRVVTTREQDGSVIMYSRKKLLYPGFNYIKDELKGVLNKYWAADRKLYLDGEIYRHGVPLQDISGYARRESKPTDVILCYMIYDCFFADNLEMNYVDRKRELERIFAENNFAHCRLVETIEVASEVDLMYFYNLWISEKYEGAMVRTNTPYQFSYNDYHSPRLLKMKQKFDAEYEIIGYATGRKGKAEGALMFRCKTPDGHEFDVTPAMPLAKRKELAQKMGVIEDLTTGKTHFDLHWRGKMLIVTFDDRSKDGVPLRARTEGVIRTWD